LLDHLSAADLTMALGVAGVLSAAAIVATAKPARGLMVLAAVAAIAASAGMAAASSPLFDGIYEKLIYKRSYVPGLRFAHVIETRSGVVAAADDGTVFGNGLWDGVVNTDLRRNEVNGVSRAYMIGALHPAPKRVLVVGLGAGAWAAVVAAHPGVERVTVVEVDAGHVQLLHFYPAVSPLTSNPNVKIEIDDIRRWLARHPGEKFDVILANPTFNWRANATSLLSTEYLQLMRQHLNPGGVYFYNTTGEDRVSLTGAKAFPYAWRIGVMLAVSDHPFAPDFQKFRADLAAFRFAGEPALRLDDPADAAVLETVAAAAAHDVESRDSLLTRLAAARPITDDNMGTEWPLAHVLRFWRY
jgi:spermidine synthase